MDKELLNTISEQCVCRIKMDFVEEIGNPISAYGTAFWIVHDGKSLLVTNRHNIDARMHKGIEKHKLVNLDILIRSKADSLPKWTNVDLENITGSMHEEADVAILNIKTIQAGGLNSKDIADENYFKKEAKYLDPIFFMGYPEFLYDIKQMSPIARIANIASNPSLPYSNKDLENSKNSTLVTGLSFKGGSGSIVIFPGAGMSGIKTSNSKYREPKCLGIMSGHIDEMCVQINDRCSQINSKKAHSGISYFTRSSAIHDVLQQVKIQSIEQCLRK